MPRVDFHKVMRDRIAANGGDHMQGAFFTAEDYAALTAEGATREQAVKWANNLRTRNSTAEKRQSALQSPEPEQLQPEQVRFIFRNVAWR